MSDLKSLFGKAKAVEDAGKPVTPAAPPATSVKPAFKIGGGGNALPATAKQESESGSSVPPMKASSAPAPAPSLGGFKLGGKSPSVSQPAPPAESAPDSGLNQEPPEPATPRFADETPASLPQRELPADTPEEVRRFVDNLEHLHTLAPEPELASSAIRNIMVELKSRPQYIKHVMPNDVRVMIQIMRETMGLAKAVKEKKASTRKKTASAEVAAVMAEFADLDDLG